MPVASVEDILTTKLLALTEQEPGFGPVLEIARSLREQIDWDQVDRPAEVRAATRAIRSPRPATGERGATTREAFEMLFHIKQTHAPKDCPYGKGGSRSLFDGASKDVKIHGYWLAFPQHTTYLVVETDDIAHLQRFLRPGAGVTTCEITPVSDQPAPLPND